MKKLVCFLAIVMISASASLAQTTIKGKVTSKKDGKPIEGAVIKAKEKTNLTATSDEQGNYTIVVPSEVKNLYVSSKGMKSQTVGIDGRTTINVSMYVPKTSVKNITKSDSKKEKKGAD